MHSRAELDFVKAKVAEGEEPWKTAWEELHSHDISELDWKPKPIVDVVRGVRNHPDIGGTNLMRDGAAAYSHAMQWYATGKQPHADKAIEIQNTCADTLKWKYAVVMGMPIEDIMLREVAKSGRQVNGITLLGSKEEPEWRQSPGSGDREAGAVRLHVAAGIEDRVGGGCC